jgi:hypothetical protein
MARPLPINSISLTSAGAGLVTDDHGMVAPDQVAGLLVDDVRVVSTWRVELPSMTAQLVGYDQPDPSRDLLTFIVFSARRIDPCALLERRREVNGRGMTETLRLVSLGEAIEQQVRVSICRDDLTMYDIGGPAVAPQALPISDAEGQLMLPGGGEGPIILDAPGMSLVDGVLVAEVTLVPGDAWSATIRITVPSADRLAAVSPPLSPSRVTSTPPVLGQVISEAREQLAPLVIPWAGRTVAAAGSPFFLAVFGRDAMITAAQSLLEGTTLLTDTLSLLRDYQATEDDALTRAQPGLIVHELRLGHAGVFGVPPRSPYYGAVDTPALFVCMLGEAARWGAGRDQIAALMPAAEHCLAWCERRGAQSAHGFISSAPDEGGLTNRGWKDSGDSLLTATGDVYVGPNALAEVQAYWYRALRTMADLRRWLGDDDGAMLDHHAEDLAMRFDERFLYRTKAGRYVGIAIDGDDQLLQVKTSNAGHALWAGIVHDDVAADIAAQLVADDMFSGWGVRTVGRDEPGYHPFGYHRGTVWPHDTSLCAVGAARYACADEVHRIATSIFDLHVASQAHLPELLSGLPRQDHSSPIPYPAACRPQAWAAAAPMMSLNALLGIEPDLPNGRLYIAPALHDDEEVRVEQLALGGAVVSFTARGRQVADVKADGVEVVTGEGASLAKGPWGRHH